MHQKNTLQLLKQKTFSHLKDTKDDGRLYFVLTGATFKSVYVLF